MAVVDWGAMSKRGQRDQDRDRAKRNHDTNKAVRRKEAKTVKERATRYIEKEKKKKKRPDYRLHQGAPEVLVVQKVIPPIVEPPRSQAIASIIPTVVEHPTATLVGGFNSGEGVGVPWSINPSIMGLPFVKEAIGTLLVMIGSQVVAAMASRIAGTSVSGVAYTVGRADVRLRVNTGKGAGRGRYVRPRGEGGELPDDDADPYEQPSDWWEFWKWSF